MKFVEGIIRAAFIHSKFLASIGVDLVLPMVVMVASAKKFESCEVEGIPVVLSLVVVYV